MRHISRRRLAFLIIPACFLIAAVGATRILRPNAAGTYYPQEPGKIREAVERYINEAQVQAPQGRPLRALIVPHGPYGLAGAVAGHAFKLIQPGQFDRVIILGPSHFIGFRGCSIPSVQFARTPLGDIPVDGPAVRQLDMSTLVDVRSVHYSGNIERVELHEREHALEVTLPFLQVQLGQFKLVPMLVGEFTDYHKKPDVHALDAITKKLREVIDDRTLIIVSSDFTHYGNRFSYRPFKQDIPQHIDALDQQAYDLICQHDTQGFLNYLEQTRNPICGKNAINILLRLLPPTTKGILLDTNTSAKQTGKFETSVSYAAIAFFDPPTP